MKLEVGMYVRTKDGILWKPSKIEIDEDNCYIFDDYYFYESEQLYKFSHSIIGLIEVGDYVNGYKVVSICKNRPELCVEIQSGINVNKLIYEQDIKSIVTKEQFESMSYKVGE